MITFLLILLVVSSGAWIFSRDSKKSVQTEKKPLVATTIFPLYDITKNIAGDTIDIALILPPGAEAHSFEPSPSLLRSLQDVQVIYAIGHGLDTWTTKISESLEVKTLVVDNGVPIRKITEVTFRDGEESEEEHGTTDPHYWLVVSNAKAIASTIAIDLARRFPEFTPLFDRNLEQYVKKLDQTDKEIRSMLVDISSRDLITFHDAWYYFADAYDLHIAGTFEPTAGREPTPQYLANLVEVLKNNPKTRAIYYEPQFSTEAYQSFANDYGLHMAELDDIGGIPGRSSYINLMLSNAKTIRDNQ